MHTHFLVTISASALVALAACATTPVRGPGVTTPEDESVAAAPTWTYRYRTGEYVYRLSNAAVVQSTRDTLARAESIATTIVIRYRIGGRPPLLEVSGAVDSFTVQSGTEAPTSAGAVLPISFQGTLSPDGEVLTFTSRSDTTCGSAAGPLLVAARELLPAVRLRLSVGATWEDSTVSRVCRGSIPITTTAAQHYRVRGEATFRGMPALQIQRTSRIHLSGTGTQAGQQVAVAGDGEAESMLYLDIADGRFLGSEGDYEAEISFTSGVLQQRFTQRARQEVVLSR